MRKIAFSIILISSTSLAQVATRAAAPANTVQTNAIPGLQMTNQKRVFGSLSLGYSSNRYVNTAYEATPESSVEGMLNIKLTGQHVLRTYMAATQDQNKGRETHAKDGYMAWVNDGFWYRGKVTTISQQIRLAIPVSDESMKRDEKVTGVTVAPLFMFNLTPLGMTGVMLAYQPAVTQNFHKYETNREFKTNSEHTFSQLLRVIWSFTDKTYFLSDFVYKNAWSYGGVKKNDSYDYAISLGYMVTQAFSINAGVSTNGAIKNLQNGSDQNIQVYNKNTSSFSVGLTYVF